MKNLNKGILVLADGTIFEGISVGQEGKVCGEVVFNTAQTGYQEILTDPSYAEQIIVFTQPHIGNVGVNRSDMESDHAHIKGAIMRSFTSEPSNWRSERSLHDFFKEHDIIAVSEIDTRALTHHLRNFGS
jgi:carbamoyl-phosphate synthase small subunit